MEEINKVITIGLQEGPGPAKATESPKRGPTEGLYHQETAQTTRNKAGDAAPAGDSLKYLFTKRLVRLHTVLKSTFVWDEPVAQNRVVWTKATKSSNKAKSMAGRKVIGLNWEVCYQAVLDTILTSIIGTRCWSGDPKLQYHLVCGASAIGIGGACSSSLNGL
ncbi:hypothetical protein Dda_7045 [Drechslerella dactyloides]|uniref:Uncharacterized protein n=1 Tax=Drechslerella dactyloides TaxID=74499 RepID=A0AAD6NH66_DREDA|nr:hypothetical protein Dda_7045 [Drechslerella dactyloides]